MKRTEDLYLSHCFQSYQTNVSNFSIFSGHWITMFDPFSQDIWDLFEGVFNLRSGQHVHLVSVRNLGIANLQIDWKETWRFWLFFQLVMRKIQKLLKEAAQGGYLPNNYLLPTWKLFTNQKKSKEIWLSSKWIMFYTSYQPPTHQIL